MTTPYAQHDVKLYCEWHKELTEKYPNLRSEDYKRWYPRPISRSVRIACIEFHPNAQVELVTGHGAEEFRKLYDMPAKTAATSSIPRRRLFILEEFDDETRAAVGLRLQVEPQVFHRHARVELWERPYKTAGNTLPLPSLAEADRTFALDYVQMLHLNTEPVKKDEFWKQFTLRAQGSERHIATARVDDTMDGVGTLQCKMSFWGNRTAHGGWDAMLLVDEPLRHAMYGSKVDNAVAKQASGPEPFQGGYADFIRHDSLEDARKAPAPPRTSMFDDLCFYYRNHSKHLELTQSPGSVTLFAQKIIASEYLLLLGYYRFVLNHLSWTLTRQHSLGAFDVGRVERAWSDLQAYHRRLMDHHHNVGLLITALQLPRESKPATYHTNQPNPWKDTAPDFLHIETELERLKQHAEGLQNSFTSLAGIVVSRQSLDEARSVRVLTVLGMTFLPMSLVAGLLSMGGDYLAGETRFWVYWAASIPSVFLVFGLSWLAVHVLGVLSV